MRFQVEGVIAGETHFHEPLAAFHGIQTGADEIAVEENIAGSGAKIHVGKTRLEDLSASANGIEIELARALRADERTAGGLHYDVTGDFLQVDLPGDALQGHIAHDLFHINQTVLGFELKFCFLRHR